ncbi:ATP/GTP-binding protein [[Flexibacter] sp. ATCC 35208]|uniref:AAA family ATPase n=1 Tax=[Flexibacter] sp. ATCC 35208 TaxID=1936242 RepID=UPI0009CA0195|nr:ATP-binding protein [[Flexibacter] sp. ATCC 35208]OMP76765.1 AAA family ATPase [[Flexibacter] sp. ATCC 35208]
MLIEFKFKNIFSFKDEATLLMSAVKSFKELSDKNLIVTNRGFDLLKAAAVYGANSSGKSNFVFAFGLFDHIIFNSFRDSLAKEGDRRPAYNQFRLNTASMKENSMFEISFIHDQYIYRYGFEIFGYTIKKEWLYRKQEREILLFNRDLQEFEINKESFAEAQKYKDEVNENVLLLSHLAQYNQPVTKHIIGWFLNTIGIDGLKDNPVEYTANLLRRDENFRVWAATILKYLEISNIEAGEKDGEIITYHKRYDENNLLVDSIPFDVHIESVGTRKLIGLLGPIYFTLRNGGVIFIDELDSKLHPNLTRKLVTLFQELNLNNAQIIFTAQDVTLLDKNLLRRDQVWFIEKNQFGVSELYSMSEFSSDVVRNTSDFAAKYLNNVFGAADTLELTTKIKDLLYGS